MEPAPRNSDQTYPLSALLLLMAACGVVLGLLSPVVRAVMEGDVGSKDTIVASALGATLSMCVGAVIGLYHYRPFRGLGWGILTGGSIGLIVGPIMLAPPQSLGALAGVSLAGGVLLIIIGLIFGSLVNKPKDPQDLE